MSVVSVVGGAAKTWGDDVAEKKCPDIVFDCVCFVLVKSEDEEGLVHKIGVIEKRSQERSTPIACIIDGGVMAIIQHVGSEKGPEYK